MAKTQLIRSCAFILIVINTSYSKENCEDLKIVSTSTNTLYTSVDDWLNMTFRLRTDKCRDQNYIISVERKEQDSPVILCRIHHNRTSCFLAGRFTYSCRCVSPSGPVEFWDKLERAGDVEHRWRWTDVKTGKQDEKKIAYLVENHSAAGEENNNNQLPTTINFVLGGVCSLLFSIVIIVVARLKKRRLSGSRGGNAQNETTNGNEGERTSKKSDSSTSSPGQAAGNGSKSGGSTPRSSSSGSDKPSTNPNYTSTALQEVEIHAYMDLHTRDPTYASTTSSKDPHTYMELKTLRAQSDPQQPGGERNGNDGYETPQMPGRGNQSSDGYETPQPPREGRRRSALYANQGISGEAIQEEVDYYNEA